MKCNAPWTLCLLVMLSLTACTTASERRQRALKTYQDITETASGAVTEVQSELKEATTVVQDFTEEVRGALAEVERRWNLMREGMGKVQEGKELIEEGVAPRRGQDP